MSGEIAAAEFHRATYTGLISLRNAKLIGSLLREYPGRGPERPNDSGKARDLRYKDAHHIGRQEVEKNLYSLFARPLYNHSPAFTYAIM